jgi:hypothetical protein
VEALWHLTTQCYMPPDQDMPYWRWSWNQIIAHTIRHSIHIIEFIYFNNALFWCICRLL